MSATHPLLASLGLDKLVADTSAYRDATGRLFGATGSRILFATPTMIRAARYVLDSEKPGGWRGIAKTSGIASGKAITSELDRQLAGLGKPALRALQLEASLALLEQVFRAHGWGRLSTDLTQAGAHGVVIARLDDSWFAEILPAANDFVDAIPAGAMQSYFEHISGQQVLCEEVACKSRGATQCTFVIGAIDRMKKIAPLIGQESAETIIAQLRD